MGVRFSRRLRRVVQAVALAVGAPAILVAAQMLSLWNGTFHFVGFVLYFGFYYSFALALFGPLVGILAAVGGWFAAHQRRRGRTGWMWHVLVGIYGACSGAVLSLYWTWFIIPNSQLVYFLTIIGTIVGTSVALLLHGAAEDGRGERLDHPSWRILRVTMLGMLAAPGLCRIVADVTDITFSLLRSGDFTVFFRLVFSVLAGIVVYVDPELLPLFYWSAALGGVVTAPLVWVNVHGADSRRFRVASLIYGAIVGGVWGLWSDSEINYTMSDEIGMIPEFQLRLNHFSSWVVSGMILAFLVSMILSRSTTRAVVFSVSEG